MIYANNSDNAVRELERQRLSVFEGKEEVKECPSCGAVNPETFVRHNASREIVGCDRCLKVIDWEAM
ncbi:MAG: hypothetical protein IKY39_01865 [Clostridia bacterium]|nr:hypothetical protein [Clostridia bacterium]